MENYEMYDLELEEMVANEMFPETNNPYDSENFPTKDRSRSAARRKRDYAKGKKRVETLYAKTKNWTKYPKRNEAVLRGVLRDTTSVIKQPKENFNRSAIRRQLSVKDKIMEYGLRMGENETKLNSGQLYFIEPGESASPVCNVTDAAIEYGTDLNDISTPVGSLVDIETAFDWFVKTTKDTMLAITGMYTAVLNCCPDRRVAHLALHGKTTRIRKKNRNRAFRILEEN